MSDRTRSTHQRAQQASEQTAVAVAVERLPYHHSLQEKFGVDRATWRALVEAVFPAATTVEGVILALAYCKARGLDPMKRPVHVVPIYDKGRKRMVESVWPGIGEQRTTAFRTGQYAGCDECKFGPDVETQFSGTIGQDHNSRHVNISVQHPMWAQMTVFRMVKGERMPMPGPRVYWLETYARMGRTEVPNDMWQKRPYGQIEKCAEAAALRRAFPEEVGNEPVAEEVGADSPPTIDMTGDGTTFDQLAPTQEPEPPAPTGGAFADPPPTRQERNAAAQKQPAAQKPARQPEAKAPPPREPEPPAGQFDDPQQTAAPAQQPPAEAQGDGFQAFLSAPDGTDLRPEPFTNPVTFARALKKAVQSRRDGVDIWDCNAPAVEEASEASAEAAAILDTLRQRMGMDDDGDAATGGVVNEPEPPPPAAAEPEPEDPARKSLEDRIADMQSCGTIHDLNAWNESMPVKRFAERMKVEKRADILKELSDAYYAKKASFAKG